PYLYGKTKPDPITTLSGAITSGDWSAAQTAAREMVRTWCTSEYTKDNGKALCEAVGNASRNYYNFVWAGTDKDNKPVVNRLLVNASLKPEHATDLPSIHGAVDKASSAPRLIDIFLARTKETTVRSIYTSTENPNELLTQLPDVVQKINLIGFL